MDDKLFDRVLGSLLGAGIGDALGAPAEGLSAQEIVGRFGGRITGFEDGSENHYALGNNLAEVTDDASQAFEMAKAVVECDGTLSVEAAARALVRWSESYPKYYPRNAGPTTSHVIEALKSGGDPIELGMLGELYNRGTSNGAAMRVAAAGLTRPGDLDRAVDNAVAMSRPSHGTQHAFAGACAISCAVAEALTEGATTVSVVRASLYGARRGEQIGLETARRAEGRSVVLTLGAALGEALLAQDMEDAERRLDSLVGAGGSMQEAVSCAMGLFLAADGDFESTVLSCVNIGGDTDTVACIAGSVAGAFQGASKIRPSWVEQWKSANPGLTLEPVARQLTEICRRPRPTSPSR